jgi:hypothetical protein
MLRTARFVTKFLIGVLLTLILAVVGLAVAASPNWIQTPIAGAVIAANGPSPIYVSSQKFSCTTASQQDRCQVEIADQPLTMTVFYANNSNREIRGCQSSYRSRFLRCSAGYVEAGAQLLPSVTIFSSLGLSQPQLQALRSQYWLAQWHEPRWFQVTTGLSIAAALLTALAIALSRQKTYIPLGVACMSAGIGAWCLWLGALYWLPLAALLTVVLLGVYGLQLQLPRGLTGVLSAVGVLGCSWFLSLWSLLALGLAD